jgi:mono/diheme cytochrome c family protein
MKKLSYILLLTLCTTLLFSCESEYKRDPGKVYAPDMTYSRAYDYYNTPDSINAAGGSFNKLPVRNTIAREQSLPTHIGEFDTTAAKGLKNPYSLYAKDLKEGNRLYMIHCGICHGGALDGNGPLYASGKYVAMPANLKGPNYINMPEGQMYHAIMYGKNAMGAYSSQLDAKQRWQVIAYIRSQQIEGGSTSANLITEGEAPKMEVAHATEEHKDEAKKSEEGHEHDANGKAEHKAEAHN